MERKEGYWVKAMNNEKTHTKNRCFSIGTNVCLKSNKYSTGVIIDKARKRNGLIYWKVELGDGEITKIKENALDIC